MEKMPLGRTFGQKGKTCHPNFTQSHCFVVAAQSALCSLIPLRLTQLSRKTLDSFCTKPQL